MSVVSAPAFVRDNRSADLDFESMPQTAKPPKSVTGVTPSRFQNSKTEVRRRNLTEKGLAYQLEIKLANQNSALKRLKQQMDKVNVLRDMPETTIEQLDEERFQLDRLKDAFNDAFKEHDDLLLTQKEKEDSYSYRWFDVRDREFTECRIRLCKQMQALERKSSRAPSRAQSVRSSHSMKSKASKRSKASSSSTKHLSLALIDAAAKAAKLQAEMDFFRKGKRIEATTT